ncbi:MAG: PDZ domain-containing protein [Cyanobacteria bacterium WB6_1B_304]|jgi:S1-C subfamily serine protease|nr:PDZ domain-containing protein [Cyanobacteria bacterium WB6_1B_304]
MKLSKFSRTLRRIGSYVLAIWVGAFFTATMLHVLPSQAGSNASTPSLEMEQLRQVSQAVARGEEPLKVVQVPLNQSSNFVTTAVNQVGPAVVRIDTERTVTRSVDPLFDDPFFRQFFGQAPQMPREERLRGQGSGFIMNQNGLILTNAHVVNRADRVTVTLKDGRKLNGKVQGTDEITDLAVVKIDPKGGVPVAALGDSDRVQVGDWAIAVGNPLGLDNTVTLGIISTLRRSSAEAGIPNKRLDFIQTDAAINPGNSGGPLVNNQGQVIGINTAIRADAMGIGFAIPINKARDIAQRLERGEQIAHPYLGIQMATLTTEDAKEANQDPNTSLLLPEVNGVLVVRVLPGTPAAISGLRRGDVIVNVDGQAVTRADQLQRLVENSRVGTALQFKVYRGNQIQTIAIRTGELKRAEAE